MKNIFIVILLYSCSFAKKKERSTEQNVNITPFEVVIKYNSIIEHCVYDSTICQFADIEKIFPSKEFDDTPSLELWKNFVIGQCELSKNNKLTNSQRYYEYKIQTTFFKNEAVVTFREKDNKETLYKLYKKDNTWLIYNIVFNR